MDRGNEFARLEEFVEKLLAKYRDARKQCAALETLIEERDGECEKLKATIEELRGERNVVGERVSGLIERIEQWERELESGELEDGTDLAKLQGKLFQNDQAAAK